MKTQPFSQVQHWFAIDDEPPMLAVASHLSIVVKLNGNVTHLSDLINTLFSSNNGDVLAPFGVAILAERFLHLAVRRPTEERPVVSTYLRVTFDE